MESSDSSGNDPTVIKSDDSSAQGNTQNKTAVNTEEKPANKIQIEVKDDGAKEVETAVAVKTAEPSQTVVDKAAEEEKESDDSVDSTEAMIPETPDEIEKKPEAAVLPQSDVAAPVTTEKKRHSFKPELIFPKELRNKLGGKARFMAILLLVVIIGGASYGTWQLTASKKMNSTKPVVSKFKLAVVPFKLVSTVPVKDASDVNTATNIVLNFSQPVDPDKMVNNIFLTPKVNGTFSKGTSADQVVFKPTVPFKQGTKVSVMVNGTVQSIRGSKLGAAYVFDFSTSTPNNAVVFQDQNELFDQVTSLASGQKEKYTLSVGSNVGSSVNVTLYKGDVNDLLNSLVYTNTTQFGYTSADFSDLSVPTANLVKVSSQTGLKDQGTYTVQEPDGLYAAVATDPSGKEVGFVWVDFSKFGVLLRQDDQKIVMDAQTFTNSEEIPATVSFYNLNSSVNQIGQQTVDGITTAKYPFSPSIDIATASYGGETAIIPVNILNSGGDIRVDQDLSTAQQVYGVTDKPTYKVGETLHYAGYVRNDNDVQYTIPNGGTVNLYINDTNNNKVASFTAPINSDGSFSGSVIVQSNWLVGTEPFAQLEMLATSVNGNSLNDVPVAAFTVTKQSNPASNIQVSFSQNEYLPNNTITATITATNSKGQPLINTNVDVHTFAQDYYENDPVSDLAESGNAGTELPNSPTTVMLNSSGQATYTIKPSSLPNDGNSQEVTVQGNLPNQSGVGAAGGASTIVHQGDGTLIFGVGRSQIPTGDPLVARVYANHLNGNPMASSNLSYKLEDSYTNNTITTGSATADSNGYAVITIPSSKLNKNDGMELIVSATDEYGNVIQSNSYYDVAAGEQNDTSGAAMQDLDVSGSSGNVSVGENVSLTVTSPANIRAMVTMDRGRIYNPEMVSLNQGSNTFNFTVTAALAPSFTLTFNYFLNGVYHSEGMAFNVNESSKQATIKLTDSNTVTANKAMTVQIATTDSDNNPLQTTLIAEVVSSNAYALSSQTEPNIFQKLFNPRPIMTSSSSSLSPVGSGGGRCGGGWGNSSSFANALSTTLYWQPHLVTSSSGAATLNFTPPSGSWTITVYTMSGNTLVGSGSTTFTAQ